MATEEQLLEALRRADEAGNTEDAQYIASRIKEMRGVAKPEPEKRRVGLAESLERIGSASGEDLRRASGKVAKQFVTEAPDSIIGGAGQAVRLAGDMLGAAAGGVGEAVRDPAGAAGAAARGTGNLIKDIISNPEAFARGIGSGAGGLGEAVEVGIQIARGLRGREADEAAAAARERAAASSPNAFLTGQLTGGAALGGRALVAGGPVRGAATGGVLAGGQASAEGGDTGEGVAAGAIVGGIVPGAAQAARSIGAAGRVANPEKAAARLAMQRLGIKDAKEAERMLKDASRRAGRQLSIAEMLADAEAVEAGRIASRSSRGSATARTNIDAAEATRAQSLPEQIQGRRPVVTARQLKEARGAEFEAAFNPIRNTVVEPAAIGDDSFEVLSNAARALPREIPGEFSLQTAVRAQRQLQAAQRNLDDAIAKGDEKAIQRASDALADADAIATEFPITLDLLDQARFDLNSLGAPAASGGKKSTKAFNTAKLARRVREIGVDVEPRYGAALNKFERRSRRAEAAFGGSGKSADPSFDIARRAINQELGFEDVTDALANASGAGRSGAKIGVVRKLAKRSAQSPEEAIKVSRGIARNESMQKVLKATLGEREASRIIDVAKIETAAHRALVAANPRVTTKSQVAAEQGSELARLGFSTKMGGAGMASMTKDLVDTFLVPPNVARRLSENVFDPNKAESAFREIRKIAKSDDRFIEITQKARAAAATQAPPELLE